MADLHLHPPTLARRATRAETDAMKATLLSVWCAAASALGSYACAESTADPPPSDQVGGAGAVGVPGGNGGFGTGGTIGSAGASQLTDGGASCPAVAPADNSPCTDEGTDCTYATGDCTCRSSEWRCDFVDPNCPADSPNDGDTCTAPESTRCSYGRDDCECRSGQWACR
jgi:hypothetical protein